MSRARLVMVAVVMLGVTGCQHLGAVTAQGRSETVDEIKYSYGDSPDSVVFDWHGDESVISFGPTSDYGSTARATLSAITPQDGTGHFQEATLRHLRPGTSYHYKIGLSGVDHVFTTVPTGSFRWVDIGDTMSTSCHADGAWMHREQQLVADRSPSFVTHGGDIAVPNQCGKPSLHQYFVDQQVWSTSAAFQPVWGDHEWEGLLPNSPADGLADSNSNYKGRVFITHAQRSPSDDEDKTSHPGCKAAGDESKNSCAGEDWGWFRAGGVLFISYPETSWRSWEDWQAKADALMEAAQSDPGVDFIVTYGHRPPFTDSTIGATTDAKAAIQALARTYSPSSGRPEGKYVLNLAHHAHSMEAFAPVDGLTHIVNAAGGQGLTNWVSDPRPDSVFRSMHFGLVSGAYDGDKHSLSVALVCGPEYKWQKDECRTDATLYTKTFTRPAA